MERIRPLRKKLCECGCGVEVTHRRNRYIIGHQNRVMTEETKDKIRASLALSRSGNKPALKISHCKCGCGELAKPGKTYIFGHSMIGKKLSEETKNRISIAHTGMKRPPGTGAKISAAISRKQTSYVW